jgi:ABC-2 type transport system ATP-binding protein
MRNEQLAIRAEGVRKRYGKDPSGPGLTEFDLEVPVGTVCGLLGPNGAGKTTAIRILATLLRMDAGRATVAGFDVQRQGDQVRERIGLVGQYAAVDEILPARRNLELFGRLHHLTATEARNRADDLLERFALSGTGRRPVSTFSGGMRRRLDLAASLIVRPPVLIIDEPTTGLDPAGRQEVWSAMRELVTAGTTLLLTTQYLEEADRLADRIALMRDGRVIAEGTPDELKSTSGGDWLDITLSDATEIARTRAIVDRVASAEVRVDAGSGRISVPVHNRTRALITVATALSEARIEPRDITLRRPTLDEVFLHLMVGTIPVGSGDPVGAGDGTANRTMEVSA